jgi:hypothetical protein
MTGMMQGAGPLPQKLMALEHCSIDTFNLAMIEGAIDPSPRLLSVHRLVVAKSIKAAKEKQDWDRKAWKKVGWKVLKGESVLREIFDIDVAIKVMQGEYVSPQDRNKALGVWIQF